ncbi:MAG: hypothetical protein WBH20_03865 [Oceanisphaera sp.]|uniref:hypothetical protein n=1 Tax=Oceanisphaera sp. TaxID=1929979 RepID=UPI003C763B35
MDFFKYNNHTGVSSDLYLSANDKILLKVENVKYSISQQFFRWFFRDFLRRAFILGLDARREHKGYQIVKLAGLKSPDLYCWGVPLSPFNNILSFMMIEYKDNLTPGLTYFNSLSESKKVEFMTMLADEAVVLAKYGYVHRDFHLNNFLVEEGVGLFWIDTHFRKLSIYKKKKWKQLSSSLIDSKLEGEENKNIILSVFKKNFDVYS